MTLVLVIIALSYIGVGLPDSVLGTVWPAVYSDLNLPVSLAGYISLTVSCFTVLSCLMSTRLTNRFGTGTVTYFSTFLTASALIGLSFSQNIFWFFLLSVPMGVGAGTIDSALNSFVALYCSNSQMSYLHCFYGLGVSLSPYLVSACLKEDNNWRKAYLLVGIIQAVLSFIILVFLPYWKKREKIKRVNEEKEVKTLTVLQMTRMPSVMLSCAVFFVICACEYTAGVWGSTFFAEAKGFTPDKAASSAMLFYIGMTLGRFVSGVVGKRLSAKKILYCCIGVLFFACVIIALPFASVFSQIGLFLFGFGMGPTFPNLSYLVPSLFGREISSSVIGIQLASTYVGIMIMPSLFGQIAESFSLGLYPYYLLIMLCLFVLCSICMVKQLKKEDKYNEVKFSSEGE